MISIGVALSEEGRAHVSMCKGESAPVLMLDTEFRGYSDLAVELNKLSSSINSVTIASLLHQPSETSDDVSALERCGKVSFVGFALSSLASFAPKQKTESFLILDMNRGGLGVMKADVEGNRIRVQEDTFYPDLGGDLFTNALVAQMNSKLQLVNVEALSKLRKKCEEAMCALSTSSMFSLEIDDLIDGLDWTAPLTRSELEFICKRQFEEIAALVGTKQDYLNDNVSVLFNGKATRIPQLRRNIADVLQTEGSGSELQMVQISLGACLLASNQVNVELL